MRLSEDVIRYLTVKQEGPLPTPRSSNKSSNDSEKKENETVETNNKSELKTKEKNEEKAASSEAPASDIKEPVNP